MWGLKFWTQFNLTDKLTSDKRLFNSEKIWNNGKKPVYMWSWTRRSIKSIGSYRGLSTRYDIYIRLQNKCVEVFRLHFCSIDWHTPCSHYINAIQLSTLSLSLPVGISQLTFVMKRASFLSTLTSIINY